MKKTNESAGGATAVVEGDTLEAEFQELERANGVPTPFSTLDDFFTAVPRPQETAVVGGRTLYFEGLSAENKDRLIAHHSRDDGMGNVSVENKQWRTNVIAGAWVKSFGGERVLKDTPDVARFYKNVPAQVEQEMYEIASRVSGLGDVEKRRKNSGADGGTSTPRT
jgi:hypothetical protein